MSATIEVIAQPKDASDRYQYFRNTETGQEWKALLDLRTARVPQVGGNVEVAASQLAVSVTVSPTDGAGKVLRDEAGKAIIIDALTHTFTETEMQVPDFDPQAVIVGIIAERISLGESQLKSTSKIKALVDIWGKKPKLKLTTPVKYERTEDNGL